jgi:Cu/Ag efflux protein CusF
MRKFLITTLAVAAVAASGSALALQATGTVKKWDATTHMLTLENGITYTLPSSYSSSAFTVGEKVKVDYDLKDGKHVATSAAADMASK